jgi:Xaa-Pro aminopeptidase
LPGRAPVLLVDGRYTVSVTDDIAAGRIAPLTVELVERRYEGALGTFLDRLQVKTVGFEAAHVTVAALDAWRKVAPAVQWRATQQLVERLRIIKDDAEQDTLRRAGQRLAEVVRALPQIVSRGLTERAIARAIDAAIERAGFSAPAFPTIVASGPHSAHPHARPTDRELRAGDLVVLDFGGVLDGYCVDLTRMAVVGKPTADAFALFAAVRDAHRAAVDTVRPGILASAIDAAARDALTSRGFGEAFVHATGHGLGLEVHEDPRISRADGGDSERIERGMVFTIEPGAYLSQRGGVRLEDDVLVTVDGCEVLTDAPRDLLVV